MIMAIQPFITLRDVTVRIGGQWLLAHTHWRINYGEHWVIWGANGAGKTTLARTLMGETAVVKGRVLRHYEDAVTSPDDANGAVLAMVSPEQYHHLYERAQMVDAMRHFSGLVGAGASPRDLMPGESGTQSLPNQHLINLFDVDILLNKPLEALSSGEIAKLLIARALTAHPRLLILDEPFNGLDRQSRRHLMTLLEQLAAAGIQLVLITHRMNEVAGCFSHVLHLDGGRVVWQGERDVFMGLLRPDQNLPPKSETARYFNPVGSDPMGPSCPAGKPGPHAPGEQLIRMRNVTVRYGDAWVLKGVDWTVHEGEHWALIGPNGAGKSTLLKLISGDNLQGYANELVLFGRRKGTGESVWGIRRKIGMIDDHIQARYQRRLSGYDVICSGFFDSVGLYRQCTREQRRTAWQWVDHLGLRDLADKTFVQLSFGQQRLMLIARAMVKSPRLLILDEPCNGLDPNHRKRLLAILEVIAENSRTCLLYVSHRPDEMPACITHRLYLEAGRVTRRSLNQ